MPPSTHAVAISMLLFGVGVLAAIGRRETGAKLIGVQLMVSAAALAFMGFDGLQRGAGAIATAAPVREPVGQVFALFAVSAAAAELALGLALGIALARRRAASQVSSRAGSTP